MTQTKYIDETDDLEICFKDYDNPIVKRLANGVDFEFDNDYNLTKIVLPNFYKMIQKKHEFGVDFTYDHTFFDKNYAILVINANNIPIKVKIDLSELDK